MMQDQLGPIARELGPCFEFVYLNGAIERTRGPGVSPFQPGPFYSYTNAYSPADIRDALDDLQHFIETSGPFDGVLGFSQGASIAVAYLMDHQLRHPEAAPPFDFAVLFSSVASFSPDPASHESIVASLVGTEEGRAAVENFPRGDFSTLPPKARIYTEHLALAYAVGREIGALTHDDDLAIFRSGDPNQVPRLLHPLLTPHRIRVPTVHVTGRADLPAMLEQSRLVCELCDQSSARVYRHDGGHSLPVKPKDVKAVVAAIDWAISEGMHRRTVYRALNRL